MDQSEIEAMREGFNKPASPETPVVEPVVVAPVVAPVVEEIKPEVVVTPEPVVTETKEEIPVVAPVIETPVVVPEVKVKTFDEEFSEKFDGKYKSVDEIKSILSAPKEEFADENIKHWNDLARKGVKLNKEFFELQSLDVDKMDDPQEILLAAVRYKGEGNGLSEATLKLQMEKKYNLSEWVDKDDADLTPEDNANREIMMRDARNDLDWLKNFKKERTFVKPVDENVVLQQKESERLRQESFEKHVDEIASKTTSLNTVIDIDETKKETFEYKISEADSKEFSGIMKLLTKDVGVLFNQFTEKDGQGNPQINHQKVLEMLYKNKNYDQAVKAAYNEGRAYGAKAEIKEIKNTNFVQPDGRTVDTSAPQTEDEARRQQLKKNGVQVY